MKSIYLDLDLIGLDANPNGPLRVGCPSCLDDLTVHQPDQQSPDRLLGTCEECRAWFLIDTDGGIMVRLPSVEAFRGTQLSPRGAVA